MDLRSLVPGNKNRPKPLRPKRIAKHREKKQSPKINQRDLQRNFSKNKASHTCPSRLTSSPSSWLVVLKPHLMYSVLVLLSLKPFDSKLLMGCRNFGGESKTTIREGIGCHGGKCVPHRIKAG